jgi:hypothetical protein
MREQERSPAGVRRIAPRGTITRRRVGVLTFNGPRTRSERGLARALNVGANERRHLLEAARGIVDDHGASLVVSPDSGLKELVLFSREDEKDRARDAVIDR